VFNEDMSESATTTTVTVSHRGTDAAGVDRYAIDVPVGDQRLMFVPSVDAVDVPLYIAPFGIGAVSARGLVTIATRTGKAVK
jgi:hypothetical protein